MCPENVTTRSMQRITIESLESPKMLKEKQCNKCKKILPVSKFNAGKSYKDGLQYTCRDCQKEYDRARYISDPTYGDRRRAQARKFWKKNHDPAKERNKKLVLQYGITIGDYDVMMKEQNNVCAICGNPASMEYRKVLNIDHCHETKNVRGLLCSRCNHGLGAFGDDIDVMASAISYLINSRLKKVV